jgi:hypothetical protein
MDIGIGTITDIIDEGDLGTNIIEIEIVIRRVDENL